MIYTLYFCSGCAEQYNPQEAIEIEETCLFCSLPLVKEDVEDQHNFEGYSELYGLAERKTMTLRDTALELEEIVLEETKERRMMDKLYGSVLKANHKLVKDIYEGNSPLQEDAQKAVIDHVLYQEYRPREFARLAETVANLNEMARTLKARAA